MNILDKYLSAHDLTRYQLEQVSGIRQSTWNNVKEKSITSYSVRLIMAIANAIGKSSGQVLDELIQLELEEDKLNGFSELFKQYDFHHIAKEWKLKTLLMELESYDVHIQPFTFNRLEGEKITHEKLEIVLDNAIAALSKSLENIKNGQPPIPE